VKVSVLGLGYIGLPTAAILASNQVEVIGVDVQKHIVDKVNNGKIHIDEPELEDLVYSMVKDGYLSAVTQPVEADIFMIAVPTPLTKSNEPDLSSIQKAINSLAPVLRKGNMVILESTVPVGATENMIDWMRALRPDLSFPAFGEEKLLSDVSVAHCPERVLPGNILYELVENDRIIGGVSKECSIKAKKLYKKFVKAECFLTDCRTAELSKLVENSFRDVNIAFANELSIICDKLNIDVWNLISLANHHPRVNILKPGPGVGGHCIAVDPWFIVDSAPNDTKIISMARQVNDNKPKFVLHKISQLVDELEIKITDLKIATLGLSFKANVNDLRESPALKISQEISRMNFSKHFIVEPHLQELSVNLNLLNSELVDLNFALKESDIVAILVDHDLFNNLDLNLLSRKRVFDTRGIIG
jgi:UDP-N-acetyl-D-mannosaminuronic acid dehydrogenase